MVLSRPHYLTYSSGGGITGVPDGANAPTAYRQVGANTRTAYRQDGANPATAYRQNGALHPVLRHAEGLLGHKVLQQRGRLSS